MHLVRFLACLLFLTASAPLLHAHQVASVELEFQKDASQWRLLGEMDIAYMLPETRSVLGGLPISREAAMKYPPEEFARIRKETEATLRKLIRFRFADKDVTWRIEFPDFEKQPFQLPPEAGDIALITTRIVMDALPGAGELNVHWAGEQETELIILSEESEDAKIVSTLPGGSLMLLKQTDAGGSLPVETPLTGGWLQLGFRHVLPEGRDHMLFILGLFLLLPSWRALLGQSLLFTLAHSVTLALSVFAVVKIPDQVWGIRSPVEVLIAISIAWIGIENLFTRKLGKQRLILIFSFGLIHGLGFASSIADKLEGIPRAQLTGPLIGFNVGVELAQVTLLAAAFGVLWLFRKWTVQVQTIGSVLVALAGLSWAVQRIFFPDSPIF
ncbi:MAG TPA: HupE/UreJ family protein [Luteolibacter sp.]